MNNKHFNQFKSFVNQQGGSSGNPGARIPLIVGGILFYLATQSIYYGTFILAYLCSSLMMIIISRYWSLCCQI
jgi:hypothetical protein